MTAAVTTRPAGRHGPRSSCLGRLLGDGRRWDRRIALLDGEAAALLALGSGRAAAQPGGASRDGRRRNGVR